MKVLVWLLLPLGLLAVAEIACRAYGLHTPVLYEATPYGYRVKPNQDLRRFGNRVFYNALGLRSEPAEPMPAAGVVRILCVGDSVTFGGTQTDQQETYPYQLQDALRLRGLSAEVLNASAGGWALENEEGWLRANGVLGSRFVVVQVGTHDLFQHQAPPETVGSHPSFPDRAPLFGLQELVFRYLAPRILGGVQTEDPRAPIAPPSKADVGRSLGTLGRIVDLAQSAGARAIVLLVEQPGDSEPADALSQFAKAELLSFVQTRKLELVRPGDTIEARGGRTLFRDDVHPNASGNRVIADALADAILASR